jgi:glycosyltransferase involved in cell wall biosynthesis
VEKTFFKKKNNIFFQKIGSWKNFSILDSFHRKTSCSGSMLENDCSLEVYSFAARISEMMGCKNIIAANVSEVSEFSEANSKFRIKGIEWKPDMKGYDKKFTIPKLVQPLSEKREKLLIKAKKLRNSAIVSCNIVGQINEITLALSNIQRLMNFSPVCILTLKEKENEPISKNSNLTLERIQDSTLKLEELAVLLDNFNFNLQFLGFARDNGQSLLKKTAVAVIHNNNKISRPKKTELDDFKVVALMATYNEEDILKKSVMKLVNQGIGVYVIDNWSTDSTYEIVKELEAKKLLVGSERFPQDGPDKYFQYYKLYGRQGEVAKMLNANWCICNDVDEIIASPWSNINLKEAIYIVDKMGYNAVDHTVLVFEPVDNSFTQDMDFEGHFKYFQFGKRTGHFTQVRSWKNLKTIEINTLGHAVEFKGRRIFPYKFLLKHYPIRSQSHGEKKVFRERKARFSPEERVKGMNVHYDKYDPGCNFLANPENLIFFEAEKFNEEFLIERLSGIGIVHQ